MRVIGHSRFRIPPGAIDASDSLTGREEGEGKPDAPRVFIETFIRPYIPRVIRVIKVA